MDGLCPGEWMRGEYCGGGGICSLFRTTLESTYLDISIGIRPINPTTKIMIIGY